MRIHASLKTRAFLLALIPLCLILVAAFTTINTVIRVKLKDGIKESIRRNEATLDAAETTYNRRAIELAAVASEDVGLKAGMGLLHESAYGQKPDERALSLLQAQLLEIANRLEYDFVLLRDTDDHPIAGVIGEEPDVSLEKLPAAFELFPMIQFKGILYEAAVVPINVGAENLGNLILGKKFDLGTQGTPGYAVLMHGHAILETNFPPERADEVRRQLEGKCRTSGAECEISVAGEDLMAVRVDRMSLGDKIQLLRFQSVDAAMRDFTNGFRQAFLIIGAGGLLLALLTTAFSSRSIARPLTDLISHLNKSEHAGKLDSTFSVSSPVLEVNRLADALNRAAGAIQESQNRLEMATLEFVETLAQALDARDPYTAGHSSRVSANSCTMAKAMHLSPEQVEIVRVGALLHDIGKIGVPDAVLQKPGRLTPEEYALIRLHPSIGRRILERAGRFQQFLPIVELHHEDVDGGGYPYGLTLEQIPLEVRIVHVADVYDAVTSNRAYRRAMSDAEVIELLTRNAGKMFDTDVIEVFLKMLHENKLLREEHERAGIVHSST